MLNHGFRDGPKVSHSRAELSVRSRHRNCSLLQAQETPGHVYVGGTIKVPATVLQIYDFEEYLWRKRVERVFIANNCVS